MTYLVQPSVSLGTCLLSRSSVGINWSKSVRFTGNTLTTLIYTMRPGNCGLIWSWGGCWLWEISLIKLSWMMYCGMLIEQVTAGRQVQQDLCISSCKAWGLASPFLFLLVKCASSAFPLHHHPQQIFDFSETWNERKLHLLPGSGWAGCELE